MAGPLVETKLHVPARRSTTVRRTRLTDRLDTPVRLTLVAAPAGFGKTSILADWLTDLGSGVSAAWVSLDERDNDPSTFWTYVLTSLERSRPGVAASALELLAAGNAPHETVLSELVNDLHSSGASHVLVLDDFHAIETPSIQADVAFLVQSLPANVRVVIASRVDPALPLGRLRARGDLLEIRAADLRFTMEEASAYLNDAMGLTLRAGDIEALGHRTEGWIAALQLAAISMEGRNDVASFIAGFSGDDRFIVDYLVEEVLQKQSESTREFLVETSILSRLSGDLCDAVIGASGSAEALETLDRSNLFLVPLDDHREWYRYHHLFAEMLQARLRDARPDRVRELHTRASNWFDDHGDMPAAVEHAVAASDFDRAAVLIKRAMPVMQQQRQEVSLVNWLGMLPADLVRGDPELGIGYAGALLSSGRTDGVDQLLRDAEHHVGSTSASLVAIRRSVALYRAAHAMTGGDLAAALEQTTIAVELSEDGGHIDRGSSHGLRGLVLWARGDLEGARLDWVASLDELQKAGHLSDVLGGSIAMGDILIALGRLADAEAVYRRALELSPASEVPLRGAADMHVALADVLRERGALAEAKTQLAAAEALGEHAGLPQNRHRRRMVAARVLQSEGLAAAGIPLLEEAERLYTPDFFPEVRPIPAMRARLQLAAGQKTDALTWARMRGATPEDELSYLAEFDHVTLVRVLVAEPNEPSNGVEAHELIVRLLRSADQGGRTGVVVELLILDALALYLAGRGDDALVALDRAVVLAEPQGYVRVFADEGYPMARLLDLLAKRDRPTPYLRTLLAAAAGDRPPSVTAELPEPLSPRERDVLRLLASELSGPEIARHLVLSLNTVRTHTKNIYLKLGVSSRRAAVRRARELRLLGSPE